MKYMLNKVFEALEKLDKINNYLNDVYDYKEIKEEIQKDINAIKQAITELKAIKEANPSEALYCLKTIKGSQQRYSLPYDEEIKTIEQYILKAQEQEKKIDKLENQCLDVLADNIRLEKVLEIIKEKNVLIYNLKIADNLAEYNRWVDDENALTQKEFDLLKRWVG